MRILEARDLIPQRVDLRQAVCAHRAQRARLVEALAVFKELCAQAHRAEILDRLALPGVVRVEDRVRLLVVDLLLVQRDHVGDGLVGLAVEEAPNLFEARRRDLGDVLADFDLRNQRAVLFLNRGKFVHAAENRLARGGDQPFADAEGIHLGALHEHVADDVFIEGIRSADLAVLKARVIQHLPRLAGKVGDVAAVDADARRAVALRYKHFVENADRVRNTGLEHVVRVDKERAVLRIFGRIGLERLILAVEELHPAVRHSAERRDAEAPVADRAGRADAAADVRGARAVHRAVKALCAAGAEFHHGAAVCRAHDAVRFRRDQALVVDAQKDHRFDELRLNHRPAHRDDRFAREDRRAFRHRPDVADKLEIAQVFEELFAKDVLGAQVLNVLVGEGKVLQVIDELLDARHDGEAAAVGNLAEEHVEISDRILESAYKITVRHRDLIEIRQQSA